MGPRADTTDERRAPGRPRSADADRAIVEATLELLTESGVASLAIEQVAVRAGVAKATIYRRWPNKEALILDALATVEDQPPALPGTSLRDDVLTLVTAMVGRSVHPGRGQLYAWMVAESDRNPEIARKYKSLVVERRRRLLESVLRRWQEKGQLRADIDMDVAELLVTAPMLVYRVHWNPGEEPPPDLAARLVDAALSGIASDSGRAEIPGNR
jgi:AcrR family transcriptional regulator